MKILNNQKLYQCSYCGRRFLSKKGAILHEEEYCKNNDSPCVIAIKKKQELCQHKRIETIYRYMPGEAVQEPDYDICIDCGKHIA